MHTIILESPFKGSQTGTEEEHVTYAKRALKDSLERGEAPIASHLLYTQVLDDAIPLERNLGIDAGLAWKELRLADGTPIPTVFYMDYGMSSGMSHAYVKARDNHYPVIYRYIGRS